MRPTGIPQLDSAIEPLRWGWIVEFYGEDAPLRIVLHHAVAEASRHGPVGVIHVQEFGGLNPYLLRRLARLRGGSLDNIIVQRVFRLQDVEAALRELLGVGVERILIVDPYLYAPREWRGYYKLTRITASIRAASSRAWVIVFNRPSQLGSGWMPAGGNYHHHTVQVVVRLSEWRRGIRAVLVKHPAKFTPRSYYVPREYLVVGVRWVGRTPLLGYL